MRLLLAHLVGAVTERLTDEEIDDVAGMGAGAWERDFARRIEALTIERLTRDGMGGGRAAKALDPAAEIERLHHRASTDNDIIMVRSCADVLAALARRLLRERDEAIGALDEGRNRLRAAEQGMDAADADYRVAVKERDEARGLHDEHCDANTPCHKNYERRPCVPPWRPR